MRYFLFLIITVSFMQSCQKGQAGPEGEKNRPQQVRTAIAETVEFAEPVITSGILARSRESKLSFKTGGIIRRISVSAGEEVQAGQLLAQLDLQETGAYQTQAGQALIKAERDLARVEALFMDSVATRQQFQDAQTARDVAKANLQIAAFNLTQSSIRAPQRGRILQIIGEEEELIAPGYPVLTFASSETNWRIKTAVSDIEMSRLRPGDPAEIRFDALPGAEFSGTLEEMAAGADPQSGLYPVELLLGSGSGQLYSGFIANLIIYPQKKHSLLKIPFEALVQNSAGGVSVFVPDKLGLALQKNIRVFALHNDQALISEGLTPGEQVITDGAAYLSAGMPVEIMAEGQKQ